MIGFDRQKSNAIREWIIFTISVGVGAHIVLGLMLHSPDTWPLESLWIYGLLISLSVYVAVQLSRSLWWAYRSRYGEDSSDESED